MTQNKIHRILTILLLLSAIGYTSLTADFRTEQIDAKENRLFQMSDRSGKVESNGAMHIAYAADNLYYATNKSGNWVIETADAYITSGGDTSIALDSSGYTHIVYHGTGYGLKYATNNSGSWVVVTVDDWPNYGYDTSIAIDSNDKIHVSYSNDLCGPNPSGSYMNLRYATNKSGSWMIETLDSSDWAGGYSSIALDSNNKVYISYRMGGYELRYVTNKSGSWVVETLNTDGGSGSSIAVDSSDKVHISYRSFTGLKYTTNASGIWTSQVLDNVGEIGLYTSLAIDNNNKVHISYYYSDGFSYESYKLRYIHNKNSSWVNEEVDSSAGVGQYSSISLDGNNNVHISYFDRLNFALKYATNATVTVPLFGPLGALLLIALFGFTAIRKIDKV